MTDSNPEIKLPPLDHVTMVVKDVNKAVEYYKSFGLGPFKVFDEDIKGYMYKGKQCDCRIRNGVMFGPPIYFALAEPLEGESVFSDYLNEKGEGVHHIGFPLSNSDELERLLAEYAAIGIEPVSRGKGKTYEFAYLNSTEIGSVMIELLCHRSYLDIMLDDVY